MIWYIRIRSQILQKLHGYRNRYLSKNLAAICLKVPRLLAKLSISKHGKITVLESVLTYLLQDINKKSRDHMYKNVSIIIDAKDNAAAMNLVTTAMIESFNAQKDSLLSTLTVRNFAEKIIEDVSKLNFRNRDSIYKAIILRFAIELSHDNLTEITNTLLPNIKDKKQQKDGFMMYG